MAIFYKLEFFKCFKKASESTGTGKGDETQGKPAGRGDGHNFYKPGDKGELGPEAAKVFSFSRRDLEQVNADEFFFDWKKNAIEGEEKLANRKIFWDWMKQSVTGKDSSAPLPVKTVLSQTTQYDVNELYINILSFFDDSNFMQFNKRAEAFYQIKIGPNEDIFNFFDRLDAVVKDCQEAEEWETAERLPLRAWFALSLGKPD